MKSVAETAIRALQPRTSRVSGERATIERLLAIVEPAHAAILRKRTRRPKRTA